MFKKLFLSKFQSVYLKFKLLKFKLQKLKLPLIGTAAMALLLVALGGGMVLSAQRMVTKQRATSCTCEKNNWTIQCGQSTCDPTGDRWQCGTNSVISDLPDTWCEGTNNCYYCWCSGSSKSCSSSFDARCGTNCSNDPCAGKSGHVCQGQSDGNGSVTVLNCNSGSVNYTCQNNDRVFDNLNECNSATQVTDNTRYVNSASVGRSGTFTCSVSIGAGATCKIGQADILVGSNAVCWDIVKTCINCSPTPTPTRTPTPTPTRTPTPTWTPQGCGGICDTAGNNMSCVTPLICAPWPALVCGLQCPDGSIDMDPPCDCITLTGTPTPTKSPTPTRTPTPTPTRTSSPTPTSRLCPVCVNEVVFQSNRDGNWEIFKANFSGSNQVQLTRTSGVVNAAPSFDPTGDSIVFESNRTGNWEIFTMTKGGLNQRNVSGNPAEDKSPVQSCHYIYFQSNRSGNWEIYRMKPNGTEQVRLTNHSAKDMQPAVSKDERIVFQSNRSGNWEIYTMNFDGSGLKRLTNTPEEEMAPSWSADGTKIIFQKKFADGKTRVAIINQDGTGLRYIDSALISSLITNQSPTWYPYCSWIFFQTKRGNIWEIWRINEMGGSYAKIISNGTSSISDVLDYNL